MPKGVNSLQLKGFYSDLNLKTIQKSYKFYVSIFDDNDPRKKELVKEIGAMPPIANWHVKNVTIPQYSFEKVLLNYGPIVKSIPAMNFEGFDIKIDFEEDEFGTIQYFINWCQSKIIRKDGTYRSQLENRISNLIIETEDDYGVPINIFWYKDVYFLNSSEVSFDYASNESITHSVTFAADIQQVFPLKAFPLAAFKSAIQLGASQANEVLSSLKNSI